LKLHVGFVGCILVYDFEVHNTQYPLLWAYIFGVLKYFTVGFSSLEMLSTA